MIVAVGSDNPTKIAPVKSVFRHYFRDVTVIGVPIPSGVSEQPLDEDETYSGALTRAKKAIESINDADYGVGIEGGLEKYNYGWFERSLVVIINREAKIGIGSSGGLVLPDQIVKKIHTGLTLEQVIDDVFGTRKIGEGIGMFGIFTKGLVTRSKGVEHGVAFALARFLHQHLY